ncbi:MAG: peptidoglycan DD-metalloendopeptidase family protein [Gammaproteobacteria bacterium]|nr:peptidoglycan DD-metalloendopeptidase family protein [Gammaproteobacteria bacterium]
MTDPGRRLRTGLAAAAAALLLGGCAEAMRWAHPERAPMSSWPFDETRRTAGAGEYVVQEGDTLYSVARRHALAPDDLAAWNGIEREGVIRPGDVLRLAPPAQAPAAGPRATVAAAPRAVERRADFQWQWPAQGDIAKSFAPGGVSNGIDIAGALGQPVMAAGPGKVVYSGSALKGYGELIIIKHDDVYLSAYGYNRRRLVQEGETVAANQPIAELGVGREQKPLLHFEIRERGKPVDPLALLPPR